MSIRVLVVEDEPPIQRSIVRCIEQNEAFSVEATAMNGRQGLELLSQICVDVVFTDIRMPVMDGLAMVRQIKELYPQMEIVILSGYQDFAYMREALLSQVTDYLLKPVTTDSIRPLLKELTERFARNNVRQRRALLEEALSGAPVEVPPEYDENYAVTLFCVGQYPLVDDAMLPGHALWNEVDLEAEAEALLTKGERCFCMAGTSAAERVVFWQVADRVRLASLSHLLWDKLCTRTPLPVSVSFTNAVPLTEAGAAHKALRKRMHKGVRLFASCLVDDDLRAVDLDAQFTRGCVRALTEALRTADTDALNEAMEDCVEGFCKAGAAQVQLVHFLEDLLNANVNLLDPQTADQKEALHAAMSSAPNAAALAGDVAYLFASLFEQSAAEAEREPPIIVQIEQYLRANFDKGVTSAQLSEQFGFVPSYLSKLLRTYRGVSPSEYLTRIRIDHARHLIGNNPSLLFKEVAAQVGFSDPYYFSKIFKKETGLWPTEYAKRN